MNSLGKLAIVVAALLVSGCGAFFPYYTYKLEADRPTEFTTQVDVQVERPNADVPALQAAWSGTWVGWNAANPTCAARLVVSKVAPLSATVIWAVRCDGASQRTSLIEATFVGAELRGTNSLGVEHRWRMRSANVIEHAAATPDGGRSVGVLSRASN